MPFDPEVLDRNDRPIQRPGADPLLSEEYAPPRGHNLDVRWILDKAALEQLLEVARASRSGRVLVHNATLRVRHWRGGDGHSYATLSIGGSGAVPEDPLIVSPRGDSAPAVLAPRWR